MKVKYKPHGKGMFGVWKLCKLEREKMHRNIFNTQCPYEMSNISREKIESQSGIKP